MSPDARLIGLCLAPPPQVANLLKEEIPQIYATCGRGPRSTLAVLRPGLAVSELAVSPLPGAPIAVWTIRRSVTDEYDQYIVVSFTNATLVSGGGGGGGKGRGGDWGCPNTGQRVSGLTSDPPPPPLCGGKPLKCRWC